MLLFCVIFIVLLVIFKLFLSAHDVVYLLSHIPHVWCFYTMDMPPYFLQMCVFWIWIRWWYCVFYVVDYIYHSPMCVGIILSDGLFNYHCFALSLFFDSSSSTFFMSTDAVVYILSSDIFNLKLFLLLIAYILLIIYTVGNCFMVHASGKSVCWVHIQSNTFNSVQYVVRDIAVVADEQVLKAVDCAHV